MSHTDYDAIVIGSGAGGLAAALCLAQAGMQVLVCEQHEVAGGWCQSFTLEGFRFSPGVHYLGGLEPGGSLNKVYKGLGVSQDMEFCEINPDGFDHIFVGQEQFDIPRGVDKFAERLKARFPQESDGIDGYLTAIHDMLGKIRQVSSIRKVGDVKKLPERSSALLRWGLRSSKDLIDHYVSDPVLKAILAGQSGDHGMPPSRVSAVVHAGVVNHYFDGGFFPRGGGFTLPRAFVRALKRAGGEIRLSTPVACILIEGNKALGVELADGTQLRAKHIISNTDPEVTYGKLIGREQLSKKLRRRIDKAKYSTSSLSLFLAADMDLRAAGLDSGNYWFYEHADLDEIYQQGTTDYFLGADTPPAVFMTATTLKDPSKMHNGIHTLEAFTFVNYEPFKAWENQPKGERAPEYQALKGELAGRMLRSLDKRVPGLRDSLVFCEMATPLSNAHYINATHGNMYGIEKSRFQVGPGAFPIRTEFENLYMCGASTLSHGVAGATGTGMTAAKRILKCSTQDLLKMDGPEIRIYPSEDTTKWPAHLQKRIARGQQRKHEMAAHEMVG
ncbi:MAG: NAD(P)/FAD-dependent oxidoreductase [Chloroflexi bacterium]|nr:NAD(P)/FAD-dependent oxidoreductase [Chloroflexota bacterium]